jgi:hypothetical protein
MGSKYTEPNTTCLFYPAHDETLRILASTFAATLELLVLIRTSRKQTSLSVLHTLNITLSNYFEVAPTIIGTTRTNISG